MVRVGRGCAHDGTIGMADGVGVGCGSTSGGCTGSQGQGTHGGAVWGGSGRGVNGVTAAQSARIYEEEKLQCPW